MEQLSAGDQWAFLSSIQKISGDQIENLISEFCHDNELGILKIDEEETQKPWEKHRVSFEKKGFSKTIRHRKSKYVVHSKNWYLPEGIESVKEIGIF